jgi:phosphomannomutase/phosphoglucomutase
MSYFAAQHLDTQCSAMVTGSHNPPDYNGLKMVIAGDTLAGDEIQALKARIEAGDLRDGAGDARGADIASAYLTASSATPARARDENRRRLRQRRRRRLRARTLFRRSVARSRNFSAMSMGVFPIITLTVAAEESSGFDPLPGNQRQRAQLAFDGDGDRLGVITRDGTIIYPDRQLMLFCGGRARRNPGATVIYDVKSTRNLQPDPAPRRHAADVGRRDTR